MRALWAELQTRGPAHYFDKIDHLADPRAAAKAIIERTDIPSIFVSDVEACDSEYLGLALDRLARTGANRRAFLSADVPSALNLGGHRGAGSVEWLDASTLALSEDEARQQFAKIGQAEDRKRLTKLGRDWPIAVEMLVDWALRSSGRAGTHKDADLLHESGLFDFIERQVWGLLTDQERAALARAALLLQPDSLLLRNAEGHDRVLAKLAIRLDGLIGQSDGTFWFNPALQTFVREHSLLSDPQAQYRNMLQLADRCSELGHLSDAARLAANAGQPSKIGEIAEQHGALLIWVVCGFGDVQSLVVNAGDAVIEKSPVLRLMRCIVDLKLGQINRAEAELHDLASDQELAKSMTTELEIIRVTLLVYGCSLARQHDLELLADLLAQQSTEPAWQSFLATLSCILNSQRARFDTANANLREARREAERAGSRYNLMFLFLHEAGIAIAEGELAKARASIASARKMWRQEFTSDVGAETVISALSSKVEFETGRLTSARNSLRKSANRLPDGEAWFDIYFAAYEPMARMHLRDHGPVRALEFLDGERAKLNARGLTRVARLLQALGHCLIGETRAAGVGCGDRLGNASTADERSWSWQERETFNLARAYHLEQSGRPEDAIALLASLRAGASAAAPSHSQFRYLLALLLIHHRCGLPAEALACLEELVVLGTRSGMRQTAQDAAGAVIAEYQQTLLEKGSLDEGQVRFLIGIGRIQQNPATREVPLSKRELDVITALAEGGSDKELARALEISDHGIRYHLKNIFRKLGVHDRLSAVLAAKQAGLV